MECKGGNFIIVTESMIVSALTNLLIKDFNSVLNYINESGGGQFDLDKKCDISWINGDFKLYREYSIEKGRCDLVCIFDNGIIIFEVKANIHEGSYHGAIGQLDRYNESLSKIHNNVLCVIATPCIPHQLQHKKGGLSYSECKYPMLVLDDVLTDSSNDIDLSYCKQVVDFCKVYFGDSHTSHNYMYKKKEFSTYLYRYICKDDEIFKLFNYILKFNDDFYYKFDTESKVVFDLKPVPYFTFDRCRKLLHKLKMISYSSIEFTMDDDNIVELYINPSVAQNIKFDPNIDYKVDDYYIYKNESKVGYKYYTPQVEQEQEQLAAVSSLFT